MHQYLFHIGDFPVRMYGLIMCLSIFLATVVAWFLARQDGRWQHAGQVDWQTRSTDTQALHQHLRAGQLQAQQPRWQELQVQGQRGRIRADPSD